MFEDQSVYSFVKRSPKQNTIFKLYFPSRLLIWITFLGTIKFKYIFSDMIVFFHEFGLVGTKFDFFHLISGNYIQTIEIQSIFSAKINANFKFSVQNGPER